jgi:hypothetical protein
MSTKILSVTSYGPVSLVLVRVEAEGRPPKVVAQFQKAGVENPTHLDLSDLPVVELLARHISQNLVSVRDYEEPEEEQP